MAHGSWPKRTTNTKMLLEIVIQFQMVNWCARFSCIKCQPFRKSDRKPQLPKPYAIRYAKVTIIPLLLLLFLSLCYYDMAKCIDDNTRVSSSKNRSASHYFSLSLFSHRFIVCRLRQRQRAATAMQCKFIHDHGNCFSENASIYHHRHSSVLILLYGYTIFHILYNAFGQILFILFKMIIIIVNYYYYFIYHII